MQTRKREEEAALAKEEQRLEKEKMRARLDAIANSNSGGGGRPVKKATSFFSGLEDKIGDREAQRAEITQAGGGSSRGSSRSSLGDGGGRGP